MSRLLADEDVRGDIVRAVRREAPRLAFVTVAELGLSATPDPAVLAYAYANEWLLVSHDVNTMRSFAERRIASGEGMRGLFLAPQSRPTRVVAESLILIWSASEAEESEDRIVYLPL